MWTMITLDGNVIGSPLCACSNRRRKRHWYRISSSPLPLFISNLASARKMINYVLWDIRTVAFILIRVKMGRAGCSWTTGWYVLVVVVVIVVDAVEPIPVLDTWPISDEWALKVWLRSRDARLLRSWSISVDGNIYKYWFIHCCSLLRLKNRFTSINSGILDLLSSVLSSSAAS